MAEFSGQLALSAVARADGTTVLAAQSFRAPYHLSKPYWDADTRTLLVQIVNPTAGILAGDRLDARLSVAAGAALAVTTPSASRVFRMPAHSAMSAQHFTVAAGGWLEVLPEPLVPHRGSRFRQTTFVDVAPGGALFLVDQLQPGRVAHGEAWQWDRLCLELTVRWGGALILRERFAHSGAELRALAEHAGSGPTACFANALLLGESPNEEWRPALHALQRDGLWIGVSRLSRGGWTLRLVAPDSIRLRAGLGELRQILATAFPRLATDLRKL